MGLLSKATQAVTGGDATEEEDGPKGVMGWMKWLWNGGMQGISTAISTLFDIAFWGAVLVGVYYLARNFQGPIGEFLENTCGVKDGKSIVHDLFAEGDKMIGQGLGGLKDMAASIMPASWVNGIAAKKTQEEVNKTLQDKGVPSAAAAVVAQPNNWQQLVKTVGDAGGKITEPFAGEPGPKVLANVLKNQPDMVKQIIVQLPAPSAAPAAGAPANGAAAGGGSATIDKKTTADVQAAIAGIVKDQAQFKALLADPKVRDVLVEAATKFSPVQFTDNGAALNALLTKVAGNEAAIGGLQKLLAPMLEGAPMDAKTQVKAVGSLLTDPAFAGVEGEVKALLNSLHSKDPIIQNQIKQINDPAIQATIKAVGPDVAAALVDAKEKFDKAPGVAAKIAVVTDAVADINKANPAAIGNVLNSPQVGGMIDDVVTKMKEAGSPVYLNNTQPLKDYIASVAGNPAAMAAITTLVPALTSGEVAPAALSNLLATQMNNGKLPALLQSIEVADAAKGSIVDTALKFINAEGNFTKTQTLFTALNDKEGKNLADIFAVLSGGTKMNELMHRVLQPDNKKLLDALQTFAKEIDAKDLPPEMREQLKSFADATPEQLAMLSQVSAEKLPQVFAALKDLKANGLNEDVVKKITTPDGMIEALMSPTLANALGKQNVRDDLALLLPLAKTPVTPNLTLEQKTQNAAIEFLAKADANGTAHPNLDAVANFFATIEKNEGGNPVLDAQNKRVAKGLVATLTSQGDASQLKAEDVDAFFSDEKNSTAFLALLNGLDVNALPPEFVDQKNLITALKEHFYVEDKDAAGKVTKAHGLAFILADADGAKFMVDKLTGKPEQSAEASTAKALLDFFAEKAADLIKTNETARDIAVAFKKIPQVVADNMDDLNELQAALPKNAPNAPNTVAGR